ncbi:GBS Bsp-like repeat-containing protein [uncultured Enterococcus sp.]|uniref:GBS Bsp-like repeat-containing protein n=1 Tax=uncultured Enterococcus sp. TaxID=167972 RepID=UPI002AA8350F|nr:GBS Bsp-like repeat-containing protein [uncultured Enterococcus sp.]
MKKLVLLGLLLVMCPMAADAEENSSISGVVESTYKDSTLSEAQTEETGTMDSSSSDIQQGQSGQSISNGGGRQEIAIGRSGSWTVAVDRTEMTNGKFKLIFEAAAPQLIKSIRVPIWSDPKQKDIVWYQAVKQSDGRYVVEFDYKNHGFNTGQYSVHVYTTTTDNQTKGLVLDRMTINQPSTKGAVFSAVPIQNYKYYRLSIKLENPNVQGVTFPSWSVVNGQDDLKWYTGKYDNQTKLWFVDIPMENHKDAGAMTTHTYIKTCTGSFSIRGDTYVVPKLSFTSTKIEPTDTSGRFKVVLQVNEPDRVAQIRVPIWSEKNGQDDIKWYIAEKQADNSFTVDFDYKNHKYDLGKYFVHAYMYSTANQVSAISVAENVQVKEEPLKGDLTVAAKDTKKSTYRATIKLNGSAKAVSFPTWTNARGQDDIKWYQGKYDSKTDTWYADIDVKNHRDGGLSQTHVWATTTAGLKFVTHKTFDIQKPMLIDKTFDMSQAENGKFTVTLTVHEPETIEKIDIPVWTNYKGQDDIRWYPTVKEKDGTFTLTIDTKNHNYETGQYLLHAYIYGKNSLCSVYSVSSNLQIPEFKLYPENLNLALKSESESIYRVSIELAQNQRVKKVMFPMWTSVNGQDDITWHTGSYDKEKGLWYADIDLRKYHWNGTNLITHVYAEVEKVGLTMLGHTSTKIPEAALPQYVNHRGYHKNAPENSIPAFEQSCYFGVETDIRLTADNRWVIMHDPTIDRTTNGSGFVEQLTFDEIQQYQFDAGNGLSDYPIDQLLVPTLEEYLAICKKKALVPVIEIKIDNASDESYNELVSIVRSYGFGENVKFISFYLEPLRVMKEKMPEISTLYLTSDITGDTIQQAQTLGERTGLNIIWSNVTAEKVKRAKDQGLSVGAWTVPASKMSEMRAAGVDYITTDD